MAYENRWGLPIDVPGVPTFNGDDRDFIVESFDGWDDGAKPDAVFVPNGGGAGAVASGPWLPTEAYYTLTGSVLCDLAEQKMWKHQLLLGLPMHTDVALVVHDVDQTRQAWVRRYDKATMALGPVSLDFSIPLMAADPYKYGVDPLGGNVGVFAGTSWYSTYAGAAEGNAYADAYADTYGSPALAPGHRYPLPAASSARAYIRAEPRSPFPEALSLTSLGTAVSRRVTISITGPLAAGTWWFYNEDTDQRLWADLDITAETPLVLDTQNLLATLGGEDVTDLVYGDWPVLAPGGNTYRLAAVQYSDAYATVTTLEAFE